MTVNAITDTKKGEQGLRLLIFILPLTSKNTPTLRTATTSLLVQENDQPHVRPLYTPLASRKIQSEYTRANTTNNTYDRIFTDILEFTISKMDQNSKPNKRIHHSK